MVELWVSVVVLYAQLSLDRGESYRGVASNLLH